jgi:DNA-binding NarL/FixJ family response regulator
MPQPEARGELSPPSVVERRDPAADVRVYAREALSGAPFPGACPAAMQEGRHVMATVDNRIVPVPPTAPAGVLDKPLLLAVRASDPVTGEGTVAYLQAQGRHVRLVPDQDLDRADVLLLLVTDVGDETLNLMRRATLDPRCADLRIVLVANTISDAQLVRAIGFGLTSFLPRQQAGLSQILRAVLNSAAGRSELPRTHVDALVEQVRLAQRTGTAPVGTDSGPERLLPREVEVLRLLADGLDTAEIAARLSYSERTIKNIIHRMITRLGVRNRAHAVAYAARVGIL